MKPLTKSTFETVSFTPADVVAVELFQIARLVVADERRDVGLLRLFGHGLRLFEPVDDPLDGRRIHAAQLPDTLADASRVILRQLRVQAVGDRLGIARIGGGHVGVERLGLGLAHVVVVVARRGEQQVVAGLLVELRRIERRIEDRPGSLAAQGVQGAELLLGDGLDRVEQVAFGEFGHERQVRARIHRRLPARRDRDHPRGEVRLPELPARRGLPGRSSIRRSIRRSSTRRPATTCCSPRRATTTTT